MPTVISGLVCEVSESDCGGFCTPKSSRSNDDDLDVSDTIAQHGDYVIEGCGCVPQVVSNWEVPRRYAEPDSPRMRGSDASTNAERTVDSIRRRC